MKSQIEFFPASFPVFGREWFDLTRPYLEAYLKVRNAFEITQRHPKHQRMTRWYGKKRTMLEQLESEVVECTAELNGRLFLREMVAAVAHLQAPPQAMLSVIAMVLIEAGAGLRAASPTDKAGVATPATHDETTEWMQAIFLRALNRSRRRGVMKPEASACCDWLELWIQTADERQLLGMSASLSDSDAFDAVFEDGAASPVVAADQVDLLTRRLAVIQGQHREVLNAYNEINDRLARTAQRILAPYNAVARTIYPWGILPLLVNVLVGDMAAALCPIGAEEPTYKTVLQPDRAIFLEAACIDPVFWYIGLTSLLRSSGATLGYGLKKWAVELIAELLRHPKRLREMTVPNEGMRTRSVLIKWIAPVLKGHRGNDQVAAKILELGPARSDHGLLVFAYHLAMASERPDGTIGYRNEDHRRTAVFFWTHLFGPAHAEILKWMADGIQESSGVVAALDKETEPAAESIEPADGDPVALPEEAERMAPGMPETWYYATNPAAASLNLVPVTMPYDDRYSVFSDFLRSQGIPTLIKPASILHALEFFRDMPSVMRAITRYDDIGTQRWHKMKRGALRIYVRIEPDGQLLFHLLPRRDWRPDLVSYARRAA